MISDNVYTYLNTDTALLQLRTTLATVEPLHLPCQLAPYEKKVMLISSRNLSIVGYSPTSPNHKEYGVILDNLDFSKFFCNPLTAKGELV